MESRLHAEAVVFDFVNPVRAGRRLLGWRWEARLNKAGGGNAIAWSRYSALAMGVESEAPARRARAPRPAALRLMAASRSIENSKRSPRQVRPSRGLTAVPFCGWENSAGRARSIYREGGAYL
jgi:hypothetical protein